MAESGYPLIVYFLSALVNYEASSSDHKTALLEVSMNLLDSQGETSISEVKVVVNSVVPVFDGRFIHNLVEARVHNVDLASTLQVLHVRGALRDLVSHLLKNFKVLFLSIFLGHAAGSDVVQVLEPLEVGASNTTSVGKHVRHGDDTTLEEFLFG